ncbi:MAG: hypothetical protein O3C57_02680 [Verrucomicrobia bacterium]|nr:hypothetical protein [Verrucomicrobiota bacterium]
MKKMVVLCHQEDRARTVSALQDMGVLHIVPSVRPTSLQIADVRDKCVAAQQALTELAAAPRGHAQHTAASNDELCKVAPEAVLETLALRTKRYGLSDELHAFENEYLRLDPLGEFNPQHVLDLAAAGVHVRLIKDTERAEATIKGATTVITLAEIKSDRYRVALSNSPVQVEGGEPFALPKQSLKSLRENIARIKKQLNKIEQDLTLLTLKRGQIEYWIKILQDELAFMEAEAGMGLHGEKIAYIQGFCPTDETQNIQSAAQQQGWGVWFESPGTDDAVPTLIRHPRWVQPIKSVFDIIGIFPGYKEIDISSVFLIFFSIFFAMIIGDGGYGLLFLGITHYARIKFPNAPSSPFTLLKFLSYCTIAWGIMTGNFFGVQNVPALLQKWQLPGLDGGLGFAIILGVMLLRKRLPVIKDGTARILYGISIFLIVWGALTGNIFGLRAVPSLLEMGQIAWLSDEGNLMRLCFLLGAIHLTIAHAWNALTILNRAKAFAQLGWILITWTMYALACNMILSSPLPGWFNALLIIGFLLVLLFMNSKAEIKKELHTYFVLPLDIIGNFVDVVSYVRLFAVGMASYAIAANFNEMALAKGITGPVSALIAALILFAGHGLNILLCVMGVLVHGVRLNTLEFSRHIGIQWAGFAFSPLHRSSQILETSSERRDA